MYQLISAQGIAAEFDGQYYDIDIANMTMMNIFKTYTNVIAILNRLSDNKEVALDLYKLPVGVRFLTQTFTQYLVSNGNRALPTEDIPEITYQYAKFYDMWEWDFSVKLIARGIHPDYVVEEDQKVDALLSKPNVNYEDVCNNFLFTVNGFIHRADFLPEGILLYDANVSRRLANNTHLGGVDFSALGGIECLSITQDMIYRRNLNQPYVQAVYLKIPKSVVGTVPALVLGGYLHVLDDMYRMVSDTVMKIDFSRYPWIMRYFTLRNQIDLESLGIEAELNGTYNIDAMTSDAVIEKLLLLSQSFIVLIKTTELRRGTVSLHHNSLPGVYETSMKPFAPMIIDDGRLTEYMVSTEHGKYALRVEHYLTDNRVLETTQYLTNAQTAPLNVSERPKQIADAFFLMLSKTTGD